jgi:hypothetical protein
MEPLYKYTMQQYILEKQIKKSSRYIYIYIIFLTIINSHQEIMLLTKI